MTKKLGVFCKLHFTDKRIESCKFAQKHVTNENISFCNRSNIKQCKLERSDEVKT